MRGAEFLAKVVAFGRMLGVAPGVDVSDVTSVLGTNYFEQRHGCIGEQLLRRDYGFVEVTFADESDWKCAWVNVEIQRFASHGDLIVEVREKHNISFSRYTSWSDVRSMIDSQLGIDQCEEFEWQDGFRSFRVGEGRAVVRVVDNPELVRGDLPGCGDVWGVEIR